MSRAFHVFVTIQAKPHKERDVEAALQGLMEPTHREDGCECYIAQRRMDRPGVFYLVEKWRTVVDFRKHTASSHLSAVMDRKDELFEVLDIAFVSPIIGGDSAKRQYSP